MGKRPCSGLSEKQAAAGTQFSPGDDVPLGSLSPRSTFMENKFSLFLLLMQ